MFRINDYVVYNSEGVYKIIEIKKDSYIDNKEIEYYVLQPAYTNNLTIKTPVNNSKVVMRGIISKDDAISLIETMPEKETIWIDDDRKRNEAFKAALKTGKSQEWAKIIKAIYLKKQEKNNFGKKISKFDEDIMKAAEKNLYEEFAVALNIAPDEVLPFILKHVS